MDYLLFTYPNCSKCEALKNYLGKTALGWEEYNLVQKESKLKIREFLGVIKRDEKDAVIIPTLVLQDEGEVQAVLNNRQELESWLKSMD